jgi:hypothetical protein
MVGMVCTMGRVIGMIFFAFLLQFVSAAGADIRWFIKKRAM